jgi:hypothetical protein
MPRVRTRNTAHRTVLRVAEAAAGAVERQSQVGWLEPLLPDTLELHNEKLLAAVIGSHHAGLPVQLRRGVQAVDLHRHADVDLEPGPVSVVLTRGVAV